jgi:7-cyano-7-deazaguanine synthase
VWESAEIYWLERFLVASKIEGCSPLTLLDLPVADLYGAHWSVTGRDVPGFDTPLESNYLPGRNLLLLSKVAVLCALRDIDRVAMAPLADNPFPDGTVEFFRAFADVASTALARRVSIEVPFRALDKADVIRRGAGLPLEFTFSCIQPIGVEHCGACTKCAERQRGFAAAGITDATVYHRPRPASRKAARSS